MIQLYKQSTSHLYEILDHIITPNSGAELDTGIYIQNNVETVVELDCMITTKTSYNNRFFAAYTAVGWSEADLWQLGLENNGTNLKMTTIGQTGGGSNNFVSLGLTFNDIQNIRYKYVLSTNAIFELIDINDNVVTSVDHSSYRSSISTTPLLRFFKFPYPGEIDDINPNTNVYGLKIKNDNILVRDYIPVKRLSDDKIGFYDNVNKEFILSSGENEFLGFSKSIPEYIDETTEQTVYVNDIKYNGNSIGRIMLDGDVYWGNDPVPVPTPVQHLIYGTCTRTSNSNIVINGETTQQTNVEVNVNNGEFWLDELPSSISSITSMKDCFVVFNGYNEGMQYLQTLEIFDLPTQNCTNWRGMFYDCRVVTSIKLSGITSACNNITALFMGCSSLQTIDFSGCVITNILSGNMYGAFSGCNALRDVYITEQSTLYQLTNSLRSQGNNYIPSNSRKCVIHYDDGTTQHDYVWNGSRWV